MPNSQKINDTCNKLIGVLQTVTDLLEDLKKEFPVTLPAPKISTIPESPIVRTQSTTPEIPVVENDLDQFESLKKALNSNRWPEAVNPHLICDPESETEKIERGRGVMELMIEDDLKKFLDIGCGEGHCTAVAATEYGASMSVGYDIKSYDSWNKFPARPNLQFTNSFETVKTNGPYDTILLFDVLDHVVGQDPISLLTMARDVLSENGVIYMRVHPFTSRHATHLYHELNKAYVHLVFSPEEIRLLLPESKYEEPNIGVVKPIVTYESYIAAAGLKIQHRTNIEEKIEPFFKIPKIAERIMKQTKLPNFPEFQLTLQFLNFKLSK